MTFSGTLILALGGTMLLAWYAFTRRRADQRTGVRGHLAQHNPGSEDYRRIARAAISAEFRETRDFEPSEKPLGSDSSETWGVILDPKNRPAETHFEPEEEYVCVYVAESSWRASLLLRFLEKHAITCTTGLIVGESETGFPHDDIGHVRVYVPAAQAGMAKTLIRKSF